MKSNYKLFIGSLFAVIGVCSLSIGAVMFANPDDDDDDDDDDK